VSNSVVYNSTISFCRLFYPKRCTFESRHKTSKDGMRHSASPGLFTELPMTLMFKNDQSYPDHPERFNWCQLLCRTGLTGRCYWEVEWSGKVEISVSYIGIRKKGDFNDCVFGFNHQSWTLFCSDGGYSVSHNNRETSIRSSVSHRVSVYVDCPAGTLSFYRVSSDSLIHLHTFNTTFTEPLYPGFGFWSGSSVCLC
uniref:B30.2/SPRY domain-containing protein n=1 Tax=Stegastes partitus TaxID=144197 RepID=A0A3B5AYK1_9TELE